MSLQSINLSFYEAHVVAMMSTSSSRKTATELLDGRSMSRRAKDDGEDVFSLSS